MTSVDSKGNVPVSAGVKSNFSSWDDVLPKLVTFADSMSESESKEVWQKIYAYAGRKSPNEKEQQAIRAAVYVYCCKNGTSREGEYSGEMILSDGSKFPAAVIPRAAGKFKIRKFLRANMDESYRFFKETGVMQYDERFVARVAKFGISAEAAFATADWLDDCPSFTPSESLAHSTMFSKSIDRARRARGGHSLETVENERIDAEIKVNGPSAAAGLISNASEF